MKPAKKKKSLIDPDRLLSPDPSQRTIARTLYESVKNLPLVCPHGHVDPRIFADPNFRFGSPTELLIIPDHYVFRMLYSQGIPLEKLGITRKDNAAVEADPRKIWQIFADNFHLFRGTPSGLWLDQELSEVFGISEKFNGKNAQKMYGFIDKQLQTDSFRPRKLFEKFNIESLCTTDAATDRLEHHTAIRESGWKGRILPTFRPDGVINIDAPGWKDNIRALSAVTGISIENVRTLVRALEKQRAFFKSMGAVATDHGAQSPYTGVLSESEANAIFTRALAGIATAEDAVKFTGHCIIESARMSIEDGLVMQFHTGVFRNHNRIVFDAFGPDKGCDIPMTTEFASNLEPLLNKYGNDARLTLILFTIDESSYARDLAPLAGHYPALRIGPPWWFNDSPNGMARYFDQVMETAGLHNTAGFNDDTRAFPSIPARHDVWRRVACNWIAGLKVKGLVDMDDAREMAKDTAYGLAKKVYKL